MNNQEENLQETQTPDYGDIDYNLDYGNFDPEEIEQDETINILMVVDVSYSITSYVDELNKAINDFIDRMQNSHHAPSIFLSFLTFANNGNIQVLNGFQPISSVPPQDFGKSLGGMTALYDAVDTGLTNLLDYKNQLEQTGVVTKNLLFVITDGDDNDSTNSPHIVKNKIDKLMQSEEDAFTFESILFGVGDEGNFSQAQEDMGIRQLAKVGTTGDEMRKMINIISASVSSSASDQTVDVDDF